MESSSVFQSPDKGIATLYHQFLGAPWGPRKWPSTAGAPRCDSQDTRADKGHRGWSPLRTLPGVPLFTAKHQRAPNSDIHPVVWQREAGHMDKEQLFLGRPEESPL